MGKNEEVVYNGRDISASTATGHGVKHSLEQLDTFINAAFK
jgi:hypothetical protein